MNIKKEGSYVLNCLIQRSKKDNLENVVLFEQVGDEIITRLDNYAIIPIEVYNALISAGKE